MSCDLDLSAENWRSFTCALRNVYANFDFSMFFVLELGACMGQTDGQTDSQMDGQNA